MYLFRGLLVWLVIMFAESINGSLRQLLLAPRIGDLAARRIGFFIGLVLIFLVTYLFVRWIGAVTIRSRLIVGLSWVVLTLLFEVGLGLIVLGYSRERIVDDYDVSRGGLMGFGLLFMLFVPLLAAKLRDGISQT